MTFWTCLYTPSFKRFVSSLIKSFYFLFFHHIFHIARWTSSKAANGKYYNMTYLSFTHNLKGLGSQIFLSDRIIFLKGGHNDHHGDRVYLLTITGVRAFKFLSASFWLETFFPVLPFIYPKFLKSVKESAFILWVYLSWRKVIIYSRCKILFARNLQRAETKWRLFSSIFNFSWISNSFFFLCQNILQESFTLCF